MKLSSTTSRIVPDNTVVKQLVGEWFKDTLLTFVVNTTLDCYPVTRGGMQK